VTIWWARWPVFNACLGPLPMPKVADVWWGRAGATCVLWSWLWDSQRLDLIKSNRTGHPVPRVDFRFGGSIGGSCLSTICAHEPVNGTHATLDCSCGGLCLNSSWICDRKGTTRSCWDGWWQ
jgi:hypothetical protein